VLGLLLVLTAALGVVGAMVHAHRVAQSAADLAALAGAHTAALGADPCGAAAGVATANGAWLVACTVTPSGAGSDVRVRVEVTGPHWLGQPHDLEAEARAGPAAR
jgi:secretion/DNA translocation related TadE-like protein